MRRPPRKRTDSEVLDWLEARGLEKLRWVIAQQPRYRRPGMVTALLDRAMPRRRKAPEEALTLAQTAVAVAVHLSGPGASALQARAWAEVGNALRVLQRFRESKAAFRHCEPLPETANEALLAEISSLRGSLDIDLGHYRKAAKAFRRAAEVYRGLERVADECRQVVKLGRVLTCLGHYGEALREQHSVIQRLGATRDQEQLLISAHENAIWARIEQGAAAPDLEMRSQVLGEALAAVHAVRPLFDQFGTEDDRLKLDWLFGIALGYDAKYSGAESILRSTMAGFLAHGRITSAAEVALDLAAALLKQGRVQEARELGQMCVTTFREQEIEPHTWLALSMLRVTRDVELVLQLAGGARWPRRAWFTDRPAPEAS